ncbi:MAG: hypothetical protein QM726_11735 [Chitinophagaceae bacterium]
MFVVKNIHLAGGQYYDFFMLFSAVLLNYSDFAKRRAATQDALLPNDIKMNGASQE